jgi:hypothetical protein
MFKAGQVIWGPDPYRSKEGRPMLVMVDEDASGSLIVRTTTSKSIYADSTTPLKGGCHPDLPRDCLVDYDSTRHIPDATVLRKGIRDGSLRTDPAILLDPADLERAQKGLGISALTNSEAKAFARKRGII